MEPDWLASEEASQLGAILFSIHDNKWNHVTKLDGSKKWMLRKGTLFEYRG